MEDKSYEKFKNYAKEIDRHYITTRYADALPNISPKEAYDEEITIKIRNEVEEILEYIKKKFEKKI